MQNEMRWEMVYDQINGAFVPGVCEGVKDESAMDGKLGPLVAQIYEARDRLCQRTGISPDNDADLERLIDGAERLCRACGMLMYHYGWHDGHDAR